MSEHDDEDMNPEDFELTPGTDEYNTAMAESFRNQDKGVTDNKEIIPVTNMPEHGVEKFYNKETGDYDWQNHAKELQYRMENGKEPKADPTGDEDPAPKDDVPGDDEIKDALKDAGLNVADLENALIANGDITAEQRETLINKVGIPASLVDMTIESLQDRIEAQASKSIEIIGGQEVWEDINSFVSNTMSEGDKASYNKRLQSENWLVAVDEIKGKMKSASPTGGEGNLNQGSESGNGSVIGYRSKAQMKADMMSPQYQIDGAFRAQVMNKMRFSTYQDDTY